MLHRLISFEVKDEYLENAETLIKSFLTKLKKEEPDTLLYRSLQDKKVLTKFVHYIIFRNQDAQESHRNSLHVKRFVEELYPLCKTIPVFNDLEIFDQVIRP